MPKGTCYSGIVKFSSHPDADMHGLVRIACRSNSWLAIREKLERAGMEAPTLTPQGTWQESKSHAEQLATERHYGELLVCPIVRQYTASEYYRPVPRSLIGKQRAPTSDPPRSGMPADSVLDRLAERKPK